MVKIITVAGLTLLSLLLIKADINVIRPLIGQEQDSAAITKPAPGKRLKALPSHQFNPRPTAPLPDLHSGYIFNAERYRANDDVRSTKTGKGYGQAVRINDVIFSGALIGNNMKKALVSYPLTSSSPVRSTKRPVAKSRKPQARNKVIQLEIGDQLGGYTVKAIEADFILFSKGSESIKKMLFDADKNRHAPAFKPTKKSIVPAKNSSSRSPVPRQIKKLPVKRP